MRKVYQRFLMILYIFFKDPDPRILGLGIRAKITRISITDKWYFIIGNKNQPELEYCMFIIGYKNCFVAIPEIHFSI